jgi:type II secretory pathway pseudopilin PulG
MQKNKLNKLKLAFTLIELLVIIAIIGVLSGLIIVSMNTTKDSATLAKSKIFADSLANALIVNTISQWEFDDIVGTVNSPLANGTAVPDSWGGNNGETENSPILKSGNDCVTGKCLNFTGLNYVDCGNNPDYNLANTNHTISLWFKTVDNIGFLISRYNGALPPIGSGYAIYLYSDKIAFDAGSNVGGPWNLSDDIVNDNKWHFFAISVNIALWSNTSYLDGKSSGPKGYSGILQDYDRSLYLSGANELPEEANFIGYLDDVRIYNTLISASQIKEQYYAGLNKLLAKGQVTKEEYQNMLSELTNKTALR